jgi:hypothetical protein
MCQEKGNNSNIRDEKKLTVSEVKERNELLTRLEDSGEFDKYVRLIVLFVWSTPSIKVLFSVCLSLTY